MYEICFISFSNAVNDGRAVNMILTAKMKFNKIAYIHFGEKIFFDEKIDEFNLNISNNLSLLQKLFEFNRKIKSLRINSKVVVSCDFFSLVSAVKIKRNSKAVLIYDSREIYSALGSLSNRKFKQFIITNYEKYLINYVDKLIVSGNLDKEFLQKHFNRKLECEVILNVPYFRKAEKKNLIREKLNLNQETKIILYQGEILEGRGILKLIEAVQEIDNVALCLLGSGPLLNHYKSITKTKRSVYFLGAVPYNELFEWTCSADIGTALFEPISFSYKLALPNKLFEYSMAEIPTLATDLPAINEIYNQIPFGILVNPTLEKNDLINSINQILMPDNYSHFVKQNQKLNKIYNYENQINTLLTIFSI